MDLILNINKQPGTEVLKKWLEPIPRKGEMIVFNEQHYVVNHVEHNLDLKKVTLFIQTS
jgi:predicted HAD superfamily phosphohydrolase YqeG